MQRRQHVTARNRVIGAPGFLTGTIESPGRDGVDGVVHRLDPRDAAFKEFGGRETFGADQAAGLDG